jgi:hypothetical protein
MDTLRTFFNFYGGKYRAAPHYPAPRFVRVIEPFAGAAGYSLRHHERDIVLVERDPIIAGLWRWLIKATADEILALPLEIPTTVRDLGLDPGPSALIGFWVTGAANGPRQSPCKWMRDGENPWGYWGDRVRSRVAAQVSAIRHWTVIEGDYADAPTEEATYFVDPPYANKAGSYYRQKFAGHAALGEWCRTRRGQVIACENDGATWLPFRHFRDIQSSSSAGRGKKISKEVVWLSDEQDVLSIAA